MAQYNRNWREVVHFYDLSLQSDPAREKIAHKVLGDVQIRPIAVKISNFGIAHFLQIPVFVAFALLVIRV